MRFLLKTLMLSLLVSVLLEPKANAFGGKGVLKDLKTVTVIVEVIPAALGHTGLTSSGLETSIGARLRKCGLKVVKDADQVLYVNLNGGSVGGFFAHDSLVELREEVNLVRSPNIKTYAVTWQRGSTGIVGRKALAAIGANLNAQVDHFISDWKAVNR